MWFQNDTRSLCVWDYHVIGIFKDKQNGSVVWDLDTRLGFPVDFVTYILNSFLLNHLVFNENGRGSHFLKYLSKVKFRVIPCETFVAHFSSDRSHMIDKSTGKWLAPPPKYPPIQQHGIPSNLAQYRDMEFTTSDGTMGTVMTLSEIVEFFSSIKLDNLMASVQAQKRSAGASAHSSDEEEDEDDNGDSDDDEDNHE
eukprot:GEZU01024331.1.p1 GENE.GEZU01024331.1~~GEZU01024331.1.p1  ORF type:complete len:197 (-),score=38.88 GEZU01024331.1:27-617(-)